MTKSFFSTPNRRHSMADVDRVLAQRTKGKVMLPESDLRSTSSVDAGAASAENTPVEGESGEPGPELPTTAPAATVAPTLAALEWMEPVSLEGPSAVRRSVCGRFSVLREPHGSGYRYLAFQGHQDGLRWVTEKTLGARASFRDASKLCG
jgi:hypothetical protein